MKASSKNLLLFYTYFGTLKYWSSLTLFEGISSNGIPKYFEVQSDVEFYKYNREIV